MKQRPFPSCKNNIHDEPFIPKVYVTLTWLSVNEFYGERGYLEKYSLKRHFG